MTNPSVLPAGSTIGILGGGQLGRMLSVAAARLGYKSHIFEPQAEPPAAHVAHRVTTAAFDDEAALGAFAQNVDVITLEFENIPSRALDMLETQGCPIHPGRRALRVSQDRLLEKTFLRDLGIATAPFCAVDDLPSLMSALDTIGTPSILKTRTLGYDGKGQVRLHTDEDAPAAWKAMDGAKAILEGFVDFSAEISVIAARGMDGQIACYDPGRNIHENGILRTTTVPANIPSAVRTDAVLAAARILNALDYVGVMGVELFVTSAGLMANEIAPRVHNSGHWTQNGCLVDQFEQHIRAVAGLPLGDGSRVLDVRMQNLIGDDLDKLPQFLSSNAAVHIYGKAEPRAGRKMGHINHVIHPPL